MTAHPNHISELAFREDHGIAVSLVWNRITDGVTVIVSDLDSGGTLEIAAPRARALDVFRHPYAYAPDCLVA
jgi:hypothetical protein